MSHQETIAGLHKCQPKNAPESGTIKNMVVLNMPAKNGKKAWISIKNKKPEEGGSPYRILNVEALDWPPDQYGNVAMNLEVEATTAQPTAFKQAMTTMRKEQSYGFARATMQQGEPKDDPFKYGLEPIPIAPQSPPHAQQGEDGVMATRKHLMQVANLYALCVRCANSRVIADEIPDAHKTNEQFQSTLASIWIEASGRRSTNGVDWWSFIDRMPTTPLVPNGKHSTTASSKQKPTCTCDNTDGDDPLCPVHSA